MKRVLLTVALCIATSVAFGQKKAVSDAQSIAKGTNPDFTEARSLIKGALDNSETKDDAKTWFVAGFIEDQQFNAEKTKQILGQKPDEAKMYEAVYAVYPYFKKALDLDQVPDAKGKVKPKVTKDVKSILGADHGCLNPVSFPLRSSMSRNTCRCILLHIPENRLQQYAHETLPAKENNILSRSSRFLSVHGWLQIWRTADSDFFSTEN